MSTTTVAEAEGSILKPARKARSTKTKASASVPKVAIGKLLKEAREAKQWSLEQVAEQLKLSQTGINELETGIYEDPPPPVYIRGYLRNYARLVGLPNEAWKKAIESCPSFSQQWPDMHAELPTKKKNSLSTQLFELIHQLQKRFKQDGEQQPKDWVTYGALGLIGIAIVATIVHLLPMKHATQQTAAPTKKPMIAAKSLQQEKRPLRFSEPATPTPAASTTNAQQQSTSNTTEEAPSEAY